MTREALLVLAERLADTVSPDDAPCELNNCEAAAWMSGYVAGVRALATPPAGETPQGEPWCQTLGVSAHVCADGTTRNYAQAVCANCAGTPQGEAQECWNCRSERGDVPPLCARHADHLREVTAESLARLDEVTEALLRAATPDRSEG